MIVALANHLGQLVFGQQIVQRSAALLSICDDDVA
jgi:hypothetical protein